MGMTALQIATFIFNVIIYIWTQYSNPELTEEEKQRERQLYHDKAQEIYRH